MEAVGEGVAGLSQYVAWHALIDRLAE